MKRLLSIAAVLLPLAPALAQPLTFTTAPPTVGLFEVLTSRMEFTGKIEITGANGFQVSVPITQRQREELERETLAVADGKPVKRRLRYRVSEETEGMDGAKVKPRPVAGKTYTLDLADGKATARDAQGAEITAEEEKAALQQEMALLGQWEGFCDALGGRSWKVGDAVDPHDPKVLAALGLGEDKQLESVRMVLAEVVRGEGAPLARFDVEMRFRNQGGGEKDEPAFTFSLKGKAAIDSATCRLLSLEAEGPLTIDGSQEAEGEKLALKGTADAKMSFRIEYRPARPAA